MSLISELELMFNKIDNTIDKKIKQINYIHDKNVIAINNKFASNRTPLDNNNNDIVIASNNAYNTLSNTRENMIEAINVDLKEHMNILNTTKEDEMKLIDCYQTDGLKMTKNQYLVRIQERLSKQKQRLAFKINQDFKHFPFNMIDILFPLRYDLIAASNFSNHSLIKNHLNIIAKQLFNNHFEFQIIHTDEYYRVRNVISLNNNKFLIVLSTEMNLHNKCNKIKLSTLNGQNSIKLNIGIGFPFAVKYSDYTILAPKHTDRIIIKFREGTWPIRDKTCIHVYDYKLKLLFSNIFDEYFEDILVYKRLILIRTIYDTKLVFLNFKLQSLHVCELGNEYDKYHLKHFNCSSVYFNTVCEGGFYPIGNYFLDRLIIVDYFEKKVVKNIKLIQNAENKYGHQLGFNQYLNDIQLSILFNFDRASNIYIYNNVDVLDVYNKYGQLILSHQCKSLRETFRKLELMRKVIIYTDSENEYSLISVYNMN